MHIQRLLLESYGDGVLITDFPGKASIVTFREKAHFILNEHRPKDQSKDVGIMNMTKTVARIIITEAKSLYEKSIQISSLFTISKRAFQVLASSSLRINTRGKRDYCSGSSWSSNSTSLFTFNSPRTSSSVCSGSAPPPLRITVSNRQRP